MPEKKIAIIAFDDFTDLDLILHWDILNRVRYIGVSRIGPLHFGE